MEETPLRRTRKVLIVILALITIGVIVAAISFSRMADQMETYFATVKIDEPALSTLPDGEYEGYADAGGVITVRVKVFMESGRIKSISLLEHRNGKGKPAEAILEEMIEQQKVKVDTIASATYSSIAIQAAVADALQ